MPVSKKCKEVFCLLYTALLFISGVLLIVLSIYLGCKLGSYFKFVVTLNIAPFILIFLFGFFHILLTWLGVKGPTREHLFHVILFMVFTVIFLIAELSVGIWSMVLRAQIADESYQLMKNSFHGLVINKFDIDSPDWDTLQSQYYNVAFSDQEKQMHRSTSAMSVNQESLHCCGINNVSDYFSFIPTSCCNNTLGKCITMYQGGCKEPLAQYIRKSMLDIAFVGFGSGIFQVLGIVIFYYFYKAVKEDIALRVELRRASRAQEGNPLNRQNSQLDSKRSSFSAK